MEKKQEFRKIQGVYLTPAREIEYVQHVFRKFVVSLPEDGANMNKALLPVLYKFFNVDAEETNPSWMKKAISRQNSGSVQSSVPLAEGAHRGDGAGKS